MGKVYLKTYFYAPHEIDFINLNLKEAYDHIDGFIVCEFNRTHTGHERELIWEKHKHHIDQDKIGKVIYLGCDIGEESIFADEDEETIHTHNEPLMRGYFTKHMQFNPDDVIVSVDADEIIYGHLYPDLIEHMLNRTQGCLLLNLHQFFYGVNYYWPNKPFKAPVVARFDYYKHWPAQWRYGPCAQLPNEDFRAGCHFSWAMPVDAMVYKSTVYSHPRYRTWATKENFENGIKDKKLFYPDERKPQFQILPFTKDIELYPRSMFEDVEVWKKYIVTED